ncbi:MAG: hypothetical protein NT163_04520, partial [Chlorobiales bacterium]|nr:hypothetical protein [Chlorobiales bacterium]
MSEDFKFIRDFKKIDWKATLQVNALRAEVAGVLWMIITMFMGGGWNSLIYIFWPIIYFIYGLPIGLAISWLSGIGVPFVGWLGAIISATVVIGDPITSLLHKKWPDLIPVKKYDLLNWVLIIFVLENQNDLLISEGGNIIEERAKGTAIEVINVPQSPMIDIDGNMYKT